MIYILIMNVIGFCLMGLDKHRARTRQWRMPEKILFGAALLGGSAGAWAGMYVFHHKTRHWYFCSGHTADPCSPAGAGCLFYALNQAGEVSRRVIFFTALFSGHKSLPLSADAA